MQHHESGKETEVNKIFSFDAETNGLWGQAFAIGALVVDECGTEITRFVGRLPDSEVTDSWVKENVLPKIQNIPVTHMTYAELLSDFAKFYKANKTDADVIVHMGYIVEAGLLRDMHAQGVIGDWDGPYPMLDVSGNLQQAGEDPTSVDSYVKKNELSVGEFEGGTHNPLYDSAVAGADHLQPPDDESGTLVRLQPVWLFVTSHNHGGVGLVTNSSTLFCCEMFSRQIE